MDEKTIVYPYAVSDPKTHEDNPAGFEGPNDKVGYPGLRGTDQLIVYTEAYGRPTTGTNSWGVEICVGADGMLLCRRGGDSEIPAGGFVLSGCGIWVEKLRAVSVRNTMARLDMQTKTVTLTESPAFLKRGVKKQFDIAAASIEEVKASLADIDYAGADANLQKAGEVLARLEASEDADEQNALAVACEDLLYEAWLCATPCCRVEKRAVWYRAEETSDEAVRATLTRAKNAGLTAIYLEAWIEGTTIWRSALPDVEMYRPLGGYDAMEAFCRIGHELGLEIHAWVETFFIGVVPGDLEGDAYETYRKTHAPLTETHRDWLLQSRRGNVKSIGFEDGIDMYYFNPSLPEVQAFVMRIYDELLQKYPVDGISFDYVRFPVPNDGLALDPDDFGYNENILEEFRAKTGLSARDLTVRSPEWADWCHFRAEYINEFVCRASERVRALRPDLSVSCSVFGDFEKGPLIKYQEPMNWVKRGAINEVFLMSYYLDENAVIRETRETLRRAEDMAYTSTGLAAFMTGGEVVRRQVCAVREQSAASVAFFALSQYLENGLDVLMKKSVFREDSIAPPDRIERAVPAMLSEMMRKIREIYVPRTAGSEADYPLAKLEKAHASIGEMTFDSDDTKALLETVADLRAEVEHSAIGDAAKAALFKDLDRTAYFIRVHQNQLFSV